MKELLDKLSSYNIFNYLFPGIVFVVLLSMVSEYDLVQDDIFTGVFLYYFIGLVISRVGSLLIEPFLIWIKFLQFSDSGYNKFVLSTKIDLKIDLLSEVNNMYRTLCSLFLLLTLAKVYGTYLSDLSFFKSYGSALIIILLLVIFIFSYRKQTSYVVKRIESIQEKS